MQYSSYCLSTNSPSLRNVIPLSSQRADRHPRCHKESDSAKRKGRSRLTLLRAPWVQAVLAGPRGQLHPVLEVQLIAKPLDPVMDGVPAEMEPLADLPVREAVRDQRDELQLAAGDPLHRWISHATFPRAAPSPYRTPTQTHRRDEMKR